MKPGKACFSFEEKQSPLILICEVLKTSQICFFTGLQQRNLCKLSIK